MSVPTTAADLSTTANSNSPAGTDAIGTSADDYVRAIQAIIKQENSSGANIASATAITVPSAGKYFIVTGNVQIDSIVDSWTGRTVFLKLSGTPVIAHSAGLILPGAANITGVAGDILVMCNESTGVWRCLNWLKSALVPGSLTGLAGTLAATSGGTGKSSYAVGDLLYANTTSSLAALADVAVGAVLVSGGTNTAPAYSTAPVVNLANAVALPLTTAAIPALSTANISALTNSTVAVLTTASVQALNVSHFGNLTTAQVAVLGTASVQALNVSHLGSLTTSQIAVLASSNTFGAGTTQAFAAISVTSTAQVANLNAATLGGATFAAPGAIGGGTPGSVAATTLSTTTSSTLNGTQANSATFTVHQPGTAGYYYGIALTTSNNNAGSRNWGWVGDTVAAGDLTLYVSTTKGGDPFAPGTAVLRFTSAGIATIGNLAGTGTRAVLADDNGLLTAPVSDASIKRNIIPLADQFDVLGMLGNDKIRGISFEMIKNGEHQVGFTKQMFEDIPGMTGTMKASGAGYLNYDRISAILWEQNRQLYAWQQKAEKELAKVGITIH